MSKIRYNFGHYSFAIKKLYSSLKIIVLSIFFLILGIIFTYPLLKNFSTQIPNNLFVEANHTYEWGDQLQILAGFREHKNYLEDIIKHKPLYSKEFCYTEINKCTLSEFQIVKNVIFSPYWLHTLLNTVFSDPVVYNLVILISFPLVGIPAYFLSLSVLENILKSNRNNELIAFASSLFITLAPLRLHHLLVGHKNGYLIGFILFAFLYFEYYLQNKRIKYAILSGFLFIYVSFSEQFFAYFGIIYFALRILFEEFPYDWKNLLHQVGILFKKYWIVGSSILISIFVNIVSKFGEIGKSDLAKGRPFNLIEYYSPPSISYLFKGVTFEHEHNIYIGFVGILIISISIVASVLLLKNRSIEKNKLKFFNFSLLICLIFLIIGLGSLTPVYKLLYDFLPGFNFSRTPVRAFFFVFPAIGVLYTYVAYLINNKIMPSVSIAFNSLVIVLIILSLKVSSTISLTGIPRTIPIPDNSKILFIPVAESGNFYNSIYEFEISNGNSVTVNGYNPYKPNYIDDFEEIWAPKINNSAKNGENIQNKYGDILNQLKVDKVIILDEYLNDDRVNAL